MDAAATEQLAARLAALEARFAELEAAATASPDDAAPGASPAPAPGARYLGVEDEITVDSEIDDGACKSLDILEYGVLGLHDFADGETHELALEVEGEGEDAVAKLPDGYSVAVRNQNTGELEWMNLRVPTFRCPYFEEEEEEPAEEDPFCGNAVNGRPGYDDDTNPLDR